MPAHPLVDAISAQASGPNSYAAAFHLDNQLLILYFTFTVHSNIPGIVQRY
jgi:hypothetical protein